jgi:hypothetical protein
VHLGGALLGALDSGQPAVLHGPGSASATLRLTSSNAGPERRHTPSDSRGAGRPLTVRNRSGTRRCRAARRRGRCRRPGRGRRRRPGRPRRRRAAAAARPAPGRCPGTRRRTASGPARARRAAAPGRPRARRSRPGPARRGRNPPRHRHRRWRTR